ncbi:MAG TPA: hypothetical protein VJS64_09470 [Pyrinomonadaceae bacterium]|nr:hypothetical protein [Pyrinomonadaceae bacterium]
MNPEPKQQPETSRENETGWTRKFPVIHGEYWLRFTNPPSDACMVKVNSRGVFEAGVTGDIRNRVVIDECEWLGPLLTSDTQQLIELHKAARTSLTLLEDAYNSRASQRFSAIGLSRIKSHIDDLRLILNPEKKKGNNHAD